MSQIDLRAVCHRRLEQGERHDLSPLGEKLAKASIESDLVEEQWVRLLLEDHIARFTAATGCTEAAGFAKLAQDNPEHQIRSGVTLADTREGDHLPDHTCDNCEWLAASGTSFQDEFGNWLFFCTQKRCKEAARSIQNEMARKSLEKHVTQGLCLYYVGGMGGPGYCPNPITEQDHLCNEHRGKKCELCSRQATSTMWEYGSFAYPHPRCDEHAGMWQLDTANYLKGIDALTAWQRGESSVPDVPLSSSKGRAGRIIAGLVGAASVAAVLISRRR